MNERPTILFELGCFGPQLAASGPNSSLVEAVHALSDRFRFRVVGMASPDEAIGRWHMFDGCERIAVPSGPRLLLQLGRILRETPHDLVVCNSIFDRKLSLSTMLLKRAGRLASPLLLAPRGEFSSGALGLSARRKNLYLKAMSSLGMFRSIQFQATNAVEATNIRARLPDARVLLGPNVRRPVPLPAFRPAEPGAPLRIAIASRIDRMKNHEWGLALLAQSEVPIAFDIYGPITDDDTWRKCEEVIAAMPAHVTVRYCGTVPRASMSELLAGYDLFFLPTLGENFGHAIADALIAGTPALLADTTPWRGLAAARAGADLPLGEPAAWYDFLRMFAALSPVERLDWRRGARAFAERRLDGTSDIEQLASCYTSAMTGQPTNPGQSRSATARTRGDVRD